MYKSYNAKNIDEGTLILGRDKEIRSILESLERQENRGILLVGDSGVGKTGIIKGLIKHIAEAENSLVSEKQIIGLPIPGGENHVTVQFADDTTLLLSERTNLYKVFGILARFDEATGSTINK